MSRLPSLFAPFPKLALASAAAAATLSLSPGAAHAACDPASPANTCRVTVGGLQYDVTTFTGDYDSNPSKFGPPPAPGAMPWWGSSSTAEAFANEVGLGLGLVNLGAYGPLFGYGLTPSSGFLDVDLWTQPSSGQAINSSVDISIGWTWAQTTLYTSAVPSPLPLFGAGAAFGFSRKLRKRIEESRVPAGSVSPLA